MVDTQNAKEELVFKSCLLLVLHIKDLITHEKRTGKRIGYHSRIFQHFLHPEKKFVLLGESRKINENKDSDHHPEHIVPCAYMIKELERLLKEEKYSDECLARALQKHWKIVHITREEAKRLDTDLKLKDKMPDGWDFMESCSEARLKKARIEIVPVD